jgi:hypothetical protein
MIHVFVLFVFLGIGEDKQLKSSDMYFYDIQRCNYFADQMRKSDITTYCLPRKVPEDTVVYR